MEIDVYKKEVKRLKRTVHEREAQNTYQQKYRGRKKEKKSIMSCGCSGFQFKDPGSDSGGGGSGNDGSKHDSVTSMYSH